MRIKIFFVLSLLVGLQLTEMREDNENKIKHNNHAEIQVFPNKDLNHYPKAFDADLDTSEVAGQDSSAVVYTITYSIWNDWNARTTNAQFVKIKGTEGETDEHQCNANFNVKDEDVPCVFESDVDIGKYSCVSLRTGGHDGIDLTKITKTYQVTVKIDGIAIHTIVPQGSAKYIGLDDGQTKKFCSKEYTMMVMCDDVTTIFVDGDQQNNVDGTGKWNKLATLQIPASTAVVGIKCKNDHGKYGIKVKVQNSIGEDVIESQTDNYWKCSNELHAGWSEANFSEDVSWKRATYVTRSQTDWLLILTDKKTIWTSNATDATVYCRIALPTPPTVDCKPGTYRSSTMTQCDQCRANSYSAAGATACIDCEEGKQVNTERTGCMDCKPGHYRNVNITQCDQCRANSYSAAGAIDCTECKPNTYSSEGAIACIKCEEGKETNGNITGCMDCEPGDYRNVNMTQCDQCSANSYSAAGATVCIDCEEGQQVNTERTSCESCTALDPTWNSMNTVTKFPVIPGTVLTVQCVDPDHDIVGNIIVTCVNGSQFNADPEPSCKAKCTVMDASWKNLSITEPELPVKHGETVQLKCKRKHTNRGCNKTEMIATCQNGELTSCLTNSGCVKTDFCAVHEY